MFPRVLVLLLLPFVSATVVAHSAWLRKLVTTHNRVTWPLGVAGLGCLMAGLVGALSGRYALPLTILGGAVSGFAVFSVRRTDDSDDGDDWRWRSPSPESPPPQPAGDGPTDWELFDRLRAGWERRAVHDADR
jgi:hypothetical protein